ncbi:DUF4352 domain-containing protein [Siminovitchia sediminis]|uniref:DUF4352 domain-containing protein n=1 Tax=Siminovitchia sediminis TaxID=1274353 RepID=A0ABW4KAC9_9BACI
MFKKSILLIFSVVVLILGGCGASESSSGGDSSKSDPSKEDKKLLSDEEFEKMFSEPKKYKGSGVDFYARVFIEPERDSDGTYLQAFANNHDERNVVIMSEDPSLEIASEDIIHVKGVIKDTFEGENAFGGQVTAPAILAETVEVSDYQTAFAPAKETIELNEEQNQHGYILEVQKVELADQETRVYVKVSNEMDAKINFYSFDAKLTADGKQLEEEMNYDAGYQEVQSDILPGVESEGIIVFPAIPEEMTEFTLYFEGSSENWELTLEPFVFDVVLP